jgi:hypothetical protein
LHFDLPGTDVPGFHIPPLRGWHSVRSSAPFDTEFDSDLEKWQKAKETQMSCVSGEKVGITGS